MRPQRLALCVIGGMVTVAAVIVITVLARDRVPSTPSLEGKQLTSSAAIEVSPKPTPKAGPDTTKPETQGDPHPAASNNETATAEPERPNLGYTLADVDAFFEREPDWLWTEKDYDFQNPVTKFAANMSHAGQEAGLRIRISAPHLDAPFFYMECSLGTSGDTPVGSLTQALRKIAAILAEFSDWESSEVAEWIGTAMSAAIDEALTEFEWRGLVGLANGFAIKWGVNGLQTECKGNHQVSMVAVKIDEYAGLRIGLTALSPGDAVTCERWSDAALYPKDTATYPQWQPDAPKETNAKLTGQVQTKTVERTDEHHKVSYILTITNNTADPLAGMAKVQWLDAEGFVLVEELVIKPSITPGENTFRGYVYIDTPLALKVAGTVAEVTAL